MAKKKKTKDSSNNSSYSVELTGLILILIGVIGFGFGFIGSILKKFAMFLAGTWWMVILIFPPGSRGWSGSASRVRSMPARGSSSPSGASASTWTSPTIAT